MKVIIGKTAGFCMGVSLAIEKSKKVTIENDKIYCLGEIVHNRQIIESLEKEGMVTVQNIEDVPDGENVIFRAHGEAKKIYDKANAKNLNIIDTSCPKVKALHAKVEREKERSFIIITGKKGHPEVLGTQGFAGDNSFVIETEDDILDAYKEYEKTNIGRVYVISQTTFSSKLFDELANEIEDNFAEAEVIIDKTICDATELRQAETREISKKCDYMIVIGGKNSANTKELVKVAEENCKNVYGIETVEDIKGIKFDSTKTAGIMAGASTPEKSYLEVKKYLEEIV